MSSSSTTPPYIHDPDVAAEIQEGIRYDLAPKIATSLAETLEALRKRNAPVDDPEVMLFENATEALRCYMTAHRELYKASERLATFQSSSSAAESSRASAAQVDKPDRFPSDTQLYRDFLQARQPKMYEYLESAYRHTSTTAFTKAGRVMDEVDRTIYWDGKRVWEMSIGPEVSIEQGYEAYKKFTEGYSRRFHPKIWG